MSDGPAIGTRPAQTGAVTAVVDQARSLAGALGRDDLAARLDTTIARVASPGVQLMVVGEFKQGKSTLVNTLLGRRVCPVDDDVATAVLTHVRHSTEPWARAHRRATSTDGYPSAAIEVFDPAEAGRFVSELGNPGNEKQLVRVEFGLPVPLLERGLVLVDTPGVGGLESAHGAVTIGALTEADAVIFVTDASQELTRPEVDFLRHAHDLCPTVIHVMSKIDLYPEWRRIKAICADHLDRAGLVGPLAGISSSLYEHAKLLRDEELAVESGIPALIELLNAAVVEPGEHLVLRAALHDVRTAAAQLRAPLETEQSILDDPEQASDVIAAFEAAKVRAAELQGRSAGWQTSLNDGVADLNSDIDHDLRARTRRLIQHAEATIDEADPADIWEEFEADLYTRTTNEIVANFTQFTHRVDQLAHDVEEHFAAAELGLSNVFAFAAPTAAVEGLTIESAIDLERPGVFSQALSGLRGSYGGVLMFTTIGGLAGLAAMTPAVLAVGLLMGRKSLREEKKRQLASRRQQAKSAVRKYVDEVSFQVGKDSRDSLRLTQRHLRDHFTARAEELARSTQEALGAAQAAARADQASKKQRTAELTRMLGRLTTIEQQCATIGRSLDATVPSDPGAQP